MPSLPDSVITSSLAILVGAFSANLQHAIRLKRGVQYSAQEITELFQSSLVATVGLSVVLIDLLLPTSWREWTDYVMLGIVIIVLAVDVIVRKRTLLTWSSWSIIVLLGPLVYGGFMLVSRLCTRGH